MLMSPGGLLRDWATMSLWMMGPLAVLLTYRSQRSLAFVARESAMFLMTWAFLGVPVVMGVRALSLTNRTWLSITLLLVASAFQFSRRHVDELQHCMDLAPTDSSFGVRTAWSCFVSCGPLMAALFVWMPQSKVIMFIAAVAMFAEFAVPQRFVVARLIGFATGVLALGLMFLGTSIIPNGVTPAPVHVHTH